MNKNCFNQEQEWRFPYCPKVDENIMWDKIEQYIPWVDELKNTPQDKIYHAEGDVWTHTKMTCEEIVKLKEWKEASPYIQNVLFASMLLHDVGKPETTKIEGNRITAFKHPIIGAKKSRIFLMQENCPFYTRELIFNFVYLHMLPCTFILKDFPMFSTIKSSMVLPNNLLALIALSDHRGRICKDGGETEETIEFFKQYCMENDCWDKPRSFLSDKQRFRYFVERDECLTYDRPEPTKGKVIMLSGLPGVGKDYYMKEHLSHLPFTSTDLIREKRNVVFGKEEGQIQQELKEQCKKFMRKEEDFVFNGTSLIKNNRMKWIRLFRKYNYEVEIHYLEKPLDIILKQNKNRRSVVPEKIILDKLNQIDMPTLLECHRIKYCI